MNYNSLSNLLIEKFGKDNYEQAENFPINKISIISIKKDPIKISAMILDNEREFHIIINQKKKEIYHDCPFFLIHSEFKEKMCIHIIKLFLMMNESLSLVILNDLESYRFTSEDYGSKKKSKNYLKLANRCFDAANNIEGLNYLNKAMINQKECNLIIKKYLDLALDNNLYLEFFEFLKQGYENDLEVFFEDYKPKIELAFTNFLDFVAIYSFFNLLRIINSMDKIFKYKNMSSLSQFIERFRLFIESPNFNQRYFSFYLIKKNEFELTKINSEYGNIITKEQSKSLEKESVKYFLNEIDNFCIIEKLKLMKKQFIKLDIPPEKYLERYENYKVEIKELKKKVYLKKFAYLLLLIEKHNIKKSKGEFRKKRNAYVITHNEENLKKPVYHYILKRIGFYGPQVQTIKSSDIGINYFLMKKLFLDNFSTFSDVLYYKNQFWGEEDSYQIDKIKAYSLLTKKNDYSYNMPHRYSNINDFIIIEWDLVNKPLQGSLVNAYGSQIIVPDYNNPLFHDLKPFDLCFCVKNPTKIEGNLIKNISVIAKCSFKDAIISVSKGMEFIEGYYPLSLIKAILDRKMNPFDAYDLIINNPNRNFVPNYNQFIKEFKKFLFKFIKKEKNYIFRELKKDAKKRINQILFLFDLNNEIDGMNLPYSDILDRISIEDIRFNEFKTKFLEKTHEYIQNLLNNGKSGSTIVFDLKKMQFTQFSKYALKIISLRKIEFEKKKVVKYEEKYNISELMDTYYGLKFMQILNQESKEIISPVLFKDFVEFSKKMKLKLNIIDETR